MGNINAELAQRVGVEVPRFSDIKEPPMVTMLGAGRAGTKLLQSYLDGHEDILMIPGYPLQYLYPHFNTWCENNSKNLSWDILIELLCVKHASMLDSRKVLGLSGLERLGPKGDEYIAIDEQEFRYFLKALLSDMPIESKTFLLAIHYAYALCKRWDLKSKKIIFYHVHDHHFFPMLIKDFPNLRLICMVRNPRPSYYSLNRLYRIVDKAKLNSTDAMRLISRNFSVVCKEQFFIFENIRNYINQKHAVAIRLEDLEDVEAMTKRLAKWLGIEFNETMLKSTFDGKLWMGDITNSTPINGFNTYIFSEAWKDSVSRVDLFVIEGIAFHFFEKYNYRPMSYKYDTSLNRLLLILAIPLLTRIEWRIIRLFLNPRTHTRFLKAALCESRGDLPRKDYSWNATYRYKFTYTDMKLWRKRWYEKFLDYSNGLCAKKPDSLFANAIITFSRFCYVVANYGRFVITVVAFPVHVFNRWCVYYDAFWRRLHGKVFLPDSL